MELKKLFEETEAKSAGVRKLIASVIDEQSFVETDVLLRTETPLGAAAGEGVVGGFAAIDGLRSVVFATNPDVLKGSIGRKAADKIVRLVDNAVKASAPIVALFDTMGARFAEGVEAVSGYSAILKAFATAYGAVPIIIVTVGNNLGMPAYLAAYCDCCIGYDKSVMATASPLVLAAKDGAGVEAVGTAKVLASNGIYSMTVKNNAELKKTITSVLSYIADPEIEPTDDANRTIKKAAGRALINELFDKGSFCELKQAFGSDVITGFARLDGTAVGVVANDGTVDGGRLSPEGAIKVTELLLTCDSFDIPVINLVDCAGSVADLKREAMTIREIGNMIYTYATADIAKVAVVTGSAFGTGYAAFADRSICDYTAAWNTALIGAIESKAAANLLYAADIAKAKNKATAEAKLAAQYAEENMSAAIAAADGYVDNVIEPEFTRQYLINAISAFGKR